MGEGLPPNPLGIQQRARVYEPAASIAFLLLGVLGRLPGRALPVLPRRGTPAAQVVHLWRRRRPGPPAGHLSGVTGAQRADPRPSRGGRALAAPPLAIGVAVLRYRLYDIDRIINRTLVYGLLTVLLGVIYSGIVLALGQLFGGLGEDPPSWVVAGATLSVAVLFQPARRRIQQGVDRRFNRRKYNTAQTIEAFSTRLRDQADLDTPSAGVLGVVDQTMQPTTASLWLRDR
jgi:hypothetical protein